VAKLGELISKYKVESGVLIAGGILAIDGLVESYEKMIGVGIALMVGAAIVINKRMVAEYKADEIVKRILKRRKDL
jgi:hypothetical protein